MARTSVTDAAHALDSTLRGQSIRVLTREGFVVVELLSTRGEDLDHATSVLASLGAELDREQVDTEVVTRPGEVRGHDVA